MHLILLEAVFDSYLVTLDSQQKTDFIIITFILHIFYKNMYIYIVLTEKICSQDFK